jgi:hypothetical protein
MFEHKSQPLLPQREYYHRIARSALAGIALVVPSMAIGMLGYHVLEGRSWLDAFLDAAMLMGGMGPVTTPVTAAGKLFAGTYAIFCGLVVILVAGVMMSPIIHRGMHRFHLEQEDGGDGSSSRPQR